MPPVFSSGHDNQADSQPRKKIAYNYPDGLDLEPGSKLHSRIKKEVLDRAQASHNVMSKRHPKWRQIDNMLTCYIEPDAEEREVKRRDSRKPISIVVPTSYGVHDVMTTYTVQTFLKPPYFRYNAVGQEDVVGAGIMERVNDQHCRRNGVGLNLHTFFRDQWGAAGLGVVAPVWKRKFEHKTTVQKRPVFNLLRQLLGVQATRTRSERQLAFEGNAIQNINPYCYLPDPNVALQDIQDGEFVGWVRTTNRMTLLNEERDGERFNVQYLSEVKNSRSQYSQQSKADGSGSRNPQHITAGSKESNSDVLCAVDEIEMYIQLVPKDWELGTSEYPEKWFFCLANDQIVTQAQPMGLDHDEFPVVPCSPFMDGYSVSPISGLETVLGLQELSNFIANTYIVSLRKWGLNQVLFNPKYLDVDDLMENRAGGFIPIREEAWADGNLEKAFREFKISDNGRNSINELAAMYDMMERATGAADVLAGVGQRGRERVTKAEVDAVKGGAMAKIDKAMSLISLMGINRIGYFFARHTQQLMEKDVKVRLIGRNEDELMKEYGGAEYAQVNPFDLIDTEFDLNEDDVYSGREDAGSIVELITAIQSNPQAAAKYDVTRLIGKWARLNGIRDLSNYEVQNAPDQQVEAQIQAGNLVPMQQGAAA